MTRLGVFGSSFNPPTLGHAVLLAEARWKLGLDQIIVVPTGDAWHKESPEALPGEVRAELARVAFEAESGLKISMTEIEREGPSYTCDTLEEIKSSKPDSQIIFLTGADAAQGLVDWHRPDRVLELATFGVAPRSGTAREAVRDSFASLGREDRLEFFEMPKVEVSSTLVRERIGAGHPWKHLVPHGVAQMIENEDLYGRTQ